MSEQEKLLELEMYFAFSCFGTVRDFLNIKSYIESFSAAKLLYDKKDIKKLYITDKDPRKKNGSAGENKN